VVDARRCLSYQTIENQGLVPLELRPRLAGHLFGCDICQEVCPYNRRELPEGDARFAPRPLGTMSAEEIAGLSPEQFEALAAGMALVRAQYDGLRRNAVLALGASRRAGARALLERLTGDPSPLVAEAARWSLSRLRGPE
jgi:epoxyqueuosine reductase